MEFNSYGYEVIIMVPSIVVCFAFLLTKRFLGRTENGLVADKLTEKGLTDKRY
jgi:hypothetical protein